MGELNVSALDEKGQREFTRAALEHLDERIRAGDTGVAIVIVKAVGVGHLLDATKPGPTDPAAVKTELAQHFESEVLVELLTGSEFADFVQKRSDQSAD